MAQVLSDLTVGRDPYAPVNPDLRQTGCWYQLDLVAALGDRASARGIMRAHMETARAPMQG